ncbi:MAG: DUF4124 domain-containing protein [Usitatibacter sp.]
MKTVWIAGMAIAASTSVFAQTTIYKHVDESGRITYSNKPMKGAVVMELDPITTFPTPAVAPTPKAAAPAPVAAAPLPLSGASITTVAEKSDEPKAQARPALAIVTPLPSARPMLASVSVDAQLQKRRDNDRRRILEEELKSEEDSLGSLRNSLVQEQQNPQLVAAVRVAQQTSDPTPSQLLEFRAAIDKASGRIRGLQATVADHEKNIEALRKELGALKP